MTANIRITPRIPITTMLVMTLNISKLRRIAMLGRITATTMTRKISRFGRIAATVKIGVAQVVTMIRMVGVARLAGKAEGVRAGLSAYSPIQSGFSYCTVRCLRGFCLTSCPRSGERRCYISTSELS